MSAREQVKRLASLNAKQAALLRKLDHSLLIQERYPQAFAHGPCSIRWTGGAKGIVRGTLTDGAGNEYELPAQLAAELGVQR